MIFDITTIGNSSGGLAEYVWLEYDMKNVLRFVVKIISVVGYRDIRQEISTTSTIFGPFYTSTYTDYITGVIKANSDPRYIQVSTTPTSASGMYKITDTFWISKIKVSRASNDTVSLQYDEILVPRPVLDQEFGTVKAIHLTEHTGSHYVKVPIVSLMGGG